VDHVGVGDHVALLGIYDDAGSKGLEGLLAHLLIGHVGAEEEAELFRQALTGDLLARDGDVDHGRGHLLEDGGQARHLLAVAHQG